MSRNCIVLISFLAAISLSFPSLAQHTPDSVSRKVNAISNNSQAVIDSLESVVSVSRLRDSLTITAWSDSLSNRIHRRFSPDVLTRATDSLRKINFPEPAIVRHADSLLQQKVALLVEVNEKQYGLQKRVSGRYTTWTENLRKKFNLDSAGVPLPVIDRPAQPSTMPANGLPAVPDPNLSAIPPIPALIAEDFSSLDASPELIEVGGSATIPSASQLGEWQQRLPVMPKPFGELNQQAAGIKDLVANPAEALQKAVTQTANVSEAVKQIREAEKLKEQAHALKAAEQLRSLDAGKEQAVNHFAGKEAELQGAMSQMAKYKKKYSSIGSLSEIKKNDWLPRNGLKGKPFRERFRPGMNLGFRSNSDTVLLDIYPNVAYRITGRMEAGLGGIYRLRLSTNPFRFDQRDPVWGLSAFAVFKTFKSIFIRMETDGTSHRKEATSEQPAYRDWRWSFHTGIQTNFKISRRWTGNVQMLYNFDSNLKDGFPEKLSARVGVEYVLK